ncbi:anthranilate synthase family protein [Actinoplanes sp. RD1]|uniref:anthranilate synthase family protein n=1 Tax=Actinoplanes sp. RD1 TaxID=3064538 RepID=UPI0027417AE6|nr:anthranilate synthase family protein [Actinoplanes sp. RD1]
MTNAFALLRRAPDRVELLACEPTDAPGDRETLTLLPYRNAAGEGGKATVLAVTGREEMTVAEAMRRLPEALPPLRVQGFDRSDAEYESIVRDVIDGNIARGDGSNFVVRRTLRARYDGWSPDAARALFRRFLPAERGAYWTFVVHAGGRTVAGMSPECHVRLRGGRAMMNPISGTWRLPPAGADPGGLERFLADGKETGELLMVLDEELKMMARVCDRGLPRVEGPRLRMMSRLVHTEYVISGPTSRTPAEVLRLTMPAPTVTGSPVARACEVIAAHEGTDRGVYGGVLALSSHGELDSVLLIRTAEITADGRVTAGVGATLVRGSDPRAEARETHAKAAALLAALRGDPIPAAPNPHPPITAAVRRQLRDRNAGLSRFWLHGPDATGPDPRLAGRRLVIVDAGDDFTRMLARMAGTLGANVQVRSWRDGVAPEADVVLLGPGPGDPLDRRDPRVDRLHSIARSLLAARTPLVAVCLGHQVLAAQLGLRITRKSEPAQGVRADVTLGGRRYSVGFYNSYAAVSAGDILDSPLVRCPVRVVRDPASGTVHALAGPGIRSAQFHVESVLTEDGPGLLRGMLAGALTDRTAGGPAARSGEDARLTMR